VTHHITCHLIAWSLAFVLLALLASCCGPSPEQEAGVVEGISSVEAQYKADAEKTASHGKTETAAALLAIWLGVIEKDRTMLWELVKTNEQKTGIKVPRDADAEKDLHTCITDEYHMSPKPGYLAPIADKCISKIMEARLPTSPTATDTPTFRPTATATATPTLARPTATATATPTPTSAIVTSQDPADDCAQYTDGNPVPCPKGFDIRQTDVSVVDKVLNIRVGFSDSFTGTLALRYTTPPGVGTPVQGVATYQGIENGNWLAWDVDASSCKREAGPVNPPNSSCQAAGKEVRIAVPVSELGPVTNPIDLRVFTIDFRDSNPNTPVDVTPIFRLGARIEFK